MDQAAAFLIGFVASVIGAIASGGGLVSIPGLLFLGLSPVSAIATTRLNIIGGGLTASYRYYKEKDIEFRYLGYFLVLAVAAGIIGPKLLLSLHQDVVENAIGLSLLISVPLLLMNRDFGTKVHKEKIWKKALGLVAFFVVMIYCTTFGAGGGIFLIEVLVYFFGMNITKANATGVAVNWFATLIALVAYTHAGVISWSLGVPSIIGAVIGGYIGASMAIQNGVKWVKLVLVCLIALFGLKLLLT